MSRKYGMLLFFSLIFISCDTFSGVEISTNELNVSLGEINNVLQGNFSDYEFRLIDNGAMNQYRNGQYLIIYDSDKILASIGYLTNDIFQISSIGLGSKSKERIEKEKEDLLKIKKCLINYYKNIIDDEDFAEKVYVRGHLTKK